MDCVSRISIAPACACATLCVTDCCTASMICIAHLCMRESFYIDCVVSLCWCATKSRKHCQVKWRCPRRATVVAASAPGGAILSGLAKSGREARSVASMFRRPQHHTEFRRRATGMVLVLSYSTGVFAWTVTDQQANSLQAAGVILSVVVLLQLFLVSRSHESVSIACKVGHICDPP